MPKILVSDYDYTLNYSNNEFNQLYPGTTEFLNNVKKRTPIYILTARNGEDPTLSIANQLAQEGVNLPIHQIIWVGAKKYQGHQQAGIDKAKAIERLRLALQLNKEDILFIDDKLEYVNAVKSYDFNAIQVPSDCFVRDQEQANQNRRAFYQYIQNKLTSQNELREEVDQAQIVEGHKPTHVMPIIQANARVKRQELTFIPSQKSSFLTESPIVAKALLGALIGFITFCVIVATITAIILTGGTAVAPISMAALIVVSTLGMAGTVLTGLAGCALMTAIGAGIGALVGKAQNEPPFYHEAKLSKSNTLFIKQELNTAPDKLGNPTTHTKKPKTSTESTPTLIPDNLGLLYSVPRTTPSTPTNPKKYKPF